MPKENIEIDNSDGSSIRQMRFLYFNCFVHSEILSLILSSFETVFNFNERQVEFLTKSYLGDYSDLQSRMLSENDSLLESVKLFVRTQGEFAKEKIKTTDNAALYIKHLFCEDYFRKFQNALLFQWGITSFTKNCTNALMWAHYADSHKEYV